VEWWVVYGQDYVSLFISSALSVGNAGALFTLFFLFLARILPIIALAPFFGARVLPHPVKITFAISLFVIFLPQLLVVTRTPVEFDTLFLLLFIKELFVGFALGFVISCPFIVVQNAGIMIDHQRGGASLMVNALGHPLQYGADCPLLYD
jgi:type III secretion protein T